MDHSREDAELRTWGWERSGPTLEAIGEERLLRELVSLANPLGSIAFEDGSPGDDAAQWRGQPRRPLLSCDVLREGVDFDRVWQSPYQVGRKAWSAAASDIAAMGAEVEVGLVAATLPASLTVSAALAIQLGVVEAAAADGARIIGGDLCRSSGEVSLAVTVAGDLDQGEPVRIRGGLPGDHLVVTGALGGAAGALERLLDRDGPAPPLDWLRRLVEPEARLAEGRLLRELGAHAMTDVSDGLWLDVRRLTDASGVGADLWLDKLPLASGMDRDRAKGVELALTGGEDFELLAALPPEVAATLERSTLAVVAVVGLLTAEPGVRLWDHQGGSLYRGVTAGGFTHF